MQIQHLHVLAHARPTMSCIPLYSWGERERAPHRRVQCEFSLFLYIYIVRRAVNHFLLVFCVFLRHALFPN